MQVPIAIYIRRDHQCLEALEIVRYCEASHSFKCPPLIDI